MVAVGKGILDASVLVARLACATIVEVLVVVIVDEIVVGAFGAIDVGNSRGHIDCDISGINCGVSVNDGNIVTW